jgi:2-polyprenyl-3-methyl-5-hydroxy-6-metoxy-1,4-benzoquinol methylase
MAHNQSQFHKQFAGSGAGKHWPEMLEWLKDLPAKSRILDWGCGQGGTITWLRNYTNRIIHGYDPYHQNYCTKPVGPYQAIYSSDMWEHVPHESIAQNWQEIRSVCDHEKLTRQCHIIDCTPAKKTFADGSNAHVSLHTPLEWSEIMAHHMNVQTVSVIRRPDPVYNTRVRVMIQGFVRWA